MPQVIEFFLSNTLLPQLLSFGLLLLLVLTVAKRLFYRLIYAFAPESKNQRFAMKPQPVRIAVAIADILSWALAVMLTGLVFDVEDVTQLLVALFGIVWNLLPLTTIVVLVAYCFSRTGNELLLSLLGFWYLQHRKKVLDRRGYFDLGKGQEGEIETIHFLDTTFRMKKGSRTEIRPNAFLMHEVFGFKGAIGLEGVLEWFEERRRDRGNSTNRES